MFNVSSVVFDNSLKTFFHSSNLLFWQGPAPAVIGQSVSKVPVEVSNFSQIAMGSGRRDIGENTWKSTETVQITR